MEQGLSWIADQAAIVAVILILAALVAVGLSIARNYHKVAPNQVAVISGRKRKITDIVEGQEKVSRVGYRVVRGGGFFLWPVFERVDHLFLNVMMIPISVTEVPDKNGVLVDVHGIANVKIMSEESALALAIERFLGKNETQIQAVAKENLESNLRSMVGTLTIEQINQDRQQLQGSVMHEAVADMGKMGLGVDLLNIQSVSDKQGYITSLGKKRTAEVQRDATIGKAEAERDSQIRSAAAKQAGAIADAIADTEISNADKTRDMQIAKNQADVKAQQARVPLIAQQTAAREQATVNKELVLADQARVEAEIELQGREKKRKEAELDATTIIQATKAREAAIIKAEGDKQSTLIVAEATRQATIIKAQGEATAAEQKGEAERVMLEKVGAGEQAKDEANARARKALASATQSEGEAEAAAKRAKGMAEADVRRAGLLADAEGNKAQQLAIADGTRAQALAEAEGLRMSLLAEAEGALEKAKAFKELDQTGQMLMILQVSTPAIAAVGDALAKVMTPVAGAIGTGLGNIKEMRVIDLGGGKNGHSVAQNMANLPVETITGIVQQANAAGLGPLVAALATRFGITLPTAERPSMEEE